MEDPTLNRSLEETRELQARWSQFRDSHNMAAKTQQRITAQAEMNFLELKSRIAMLHDGFIEKLLHDQKIGQNIMTIVGDCILLSRVAVASDAEKQKFEFDWNECFMLITEQLGSLEEEKERLAGISEKVYKASKRKEEIQAKIHNFIHSNGLRYTIILGIVVLVLYVIPAFIFPYTFFGTFAPTRPVYKIFMNFVYRPYLNHDFEYLDRAEVPEAKIEGLPTSIVKNDQQPLNDDFLKKVELPSMGVKGSDLPDAQALLSKPGNNIQYERWTAENADTRFYWIFFKTTDDAKKFVGILGTAAKSLSTENRTTLNNTAFVFRSANFVTIGRGIHVHHAMYVRERFKLDEKAASAIQQ